MAKVYKRTDIAENDIYGGITESAEKALVKVEAVDKQIVLFTEHYKALLGVTNTDTIQGIEQLKKISADLNKQTIQTIQLERDKAKIEQLNIKLKSDEIRLSNQQLKSEQQKARALKKTSLEQAILNEKQREANAQTKAIAQLRNSEANSLDSLQAKMKLVEMAYNKLTPAQIENEKRGKRLLASLTELRAELSKQQQAYGKHNLDVGNYKKAFDGLGFSVTQLAREMPAFANSMQTGFMAISNNLPMFFDEIQKIKTANKELQASGQSTKSVFSQVGASILSFQTLLSIGVTLLTVYGAKIVNWLMGTEKQNKELEKMQKHQKYVNEQNDKYAGILAKETNEVLNLLTRLKQLNKTSTDRGKILNELNTKYGFHLKNMKNELLFQYSINQAIDNYISLSKKKMSLKINEEYREMLLKKEFKAYRVLNDEIKKNKALNDKAGADFLRNQDELNALKGKELSLQERINMNDPILWRDYPEQMQTITDARREFQRVVHTDIKTQESLEDLMKRAGISIDNVTGSTKEQTKAWQDLNTQLEALDILKEYEDIAKQIEELDFNLANSFNQDDIDKAGENIQKILDEQKKAIEEGRDYDSQILDDAIEYEFQAKQRQAIRLRDFKLKQLDDEFNEEKKLKYKAIDDETTELLKKLDEQKNELLAQENLTEAQKLDINKKYDKSVLDLGQNRLEKIEQLDGIYIEKEKLKRGQETQIKADTDKEIVKLNKEKNDKLISANDELINKEQEQADKANEEDKNRRKRTEEEEEAHQKRMADFRKKMIESGLDAWKEASQEREKLIDREIDASQKLADQLGEQAKNGTIQANQSLAEQNRITNERLQAKQKEQRIQQQIEEIKLLYSATEQYLADGDTLPVAGAKAFLQVKGIKALAQSLIGFFTGTEKTIGEELGAPQLSGKDGHIVRVDGSEMVMNGTLVNKARSVDPNVTTSEIVNGFIKSKTSNVAPIYVSHSTQDSVLVSEIRDLKKVIERKPEVQMDASRIAENLFEFTTTTKKGADLIRERHIYRKQ